LIYAGKFDYARAAQEAREAIRLGPGDAEAWVALSWALGYEQPPEAIEAEKAAREAIRLQPAVEGPYYELGRALMLQQRFPEAIAAMQQASELSHNSSTSYMGLAQVYLAQGDAARALSILEKESVDRSPSVRLFWLSAAYAVHGDKEKALETLQRAFTAGYRDFAALDASPYFASLRSHPRFQQLVQRYHK
jgi:cytochrome c-type biogenesis protein CcmH/NrfG